MVIQEIPSSGSTILSFTPIVSPLLQRKASAGPITLRIGLLLTAVFTVTIAVSLFKQESTTMTVKFIVASEPMNRQTVSVTARPSTK